MKLDTVYTFDGQDEDGTAIVMVRATFQTDACPIQSIEVDVVLDESLRRVWEELEGTFRAIAVGHLSR